MDRTEIFRLTSPCGIDCFNCELLEANLSAGRRTQVAGTFRVAPGEVGCRGCREGGCFRFQDCPTRACVLGKGLAFCSQCDEFPCPRLQPSRAGADAWPHNLKVYNLCRIQAVGLRRWAEEEAAVIRRRYFEGRFTPGHGPTLEPEAPAARCQKKGGGPPGEPGTGAGRDGGRER